ncbi:MAG: epimerase [Parahaliea sp.]
MSRSLVVLGCGDLGCRLAGLLPAWQVTGLCRNPARLPAPLRGPAVDYTLPGSLDGLAAMAPDYVLSTLKPLGRDAGAYRRGFVDATDHLLAGLGAHRPRLILMVSSTRVYAERDGGWVDEDSALTGSDPCGMAIWWAEQRLLDSAQRAAVLRCGGIYGDPQGRLLARVGRGEICAPAPLRYGNRIHRDDVAGTLAHLLLRAEAGASLRPVYLGVDSEPAPQHSVESWLAQRLGVVASAQSEPSAAHRRCCNDALIDSGYRLRYPDYRSGYNAVLAQRSAVVDEGSA